MADDDQLLARSRRDPAAFGTFYERYERLVLGYFMRRTRDPELAADLAAETFAVALVAARKYRGDGAPASAWLIGIARNTLFNSLRARGWRTAPAAASAWSRSDSTTSCCSASSASAATPASRPCSPS
ncbi:RNA polymerase sigma factor [Solirubrobacter soli]|uniref:RNA polymerase sigma factor n=1 Tax=Solirubrobacter soli TaxID=363832 RepID=UPI0003F7ADC5|nr:sigma factor [Solirubrobacter soli]